MSREAQVRQLGTGCLLLAALFFLAVGAATAIRAVRDLMRGAELPLIAGPGIAGIVFTLAGLAMIAASLAQRRRHTRSADLRARHPGRPWLWNPQWTTGRIESSGRASLAALWLLVLVWNAISSLALIFVSAELEQGHRAALLALLFPIAGLGLLLWAARSTVRWRKFGTSILALAGTPVVLGRELHARLITRLDPPPDHMRLVLSCIRRHHGEDDTSEEVVWRQEQVIAAAAIQRNAAATIAKVVFAIPEQLPPAGSGLGWSVHWQLHATAPMPGVNYDSTFELPVFRLRDIEAAAEEDAQRRS